MDEYHRTNNQQVVIYEALCFDVAQGQMNGAPNETNNQQVAFVCKYIKHNLIKEYSLSCYLPIAERE